MPSKRRAFRFSSPPRVRGKGILAQFQRSGLRITPAGAGRRPIYRKDERNPEDHPRRCGEKIDRVNRQIKQAGSPPRVRGEVVLDSPQR